MELAVKLEAFEGPLDLLLHLIEKNRIDIYDIPIVEITEQYLDYIRKMKEADMDVMSEFLLMAATLLDIKCRMLLPREESEEEEEDSDPREELVQRLLEYKLYKYMSYELRDLMENAEGVMFRRQELPEEVLSYKPPVDYEELLQGVSLPALQEILQGLLKRNEEKLDPIRSKFGKIEKEEIDMDRKTAYIGEYIRSRKSCSFRELLEKEGSKQEIIVAFLVILEMAKNGEIEIFQEGESEISLKAKKA